MNISVASLEGVREALRNRPPIAPDNSDDAVKKGVDLVAIAKELAKRNQMKKKQPR
jgi:hypothetical protein